MVTEVLIIYPSFQEIVIQDLTDFVQNYFRVIMHYQYDPLWRPGLRFLYEDCGDLQIIRFTNVQIMELRTLRYTVYFTGYTLSWSYL